MNRASTRAVAYYRSYSRALIKYASNGFFSRFLDADDIAFIEGIRESGRLRCGSLAELTPTDATFSDDVVHRVALIEELDFWRQPYQVDKVAVRRIGPPMRLKPPPAGSTPHAIELKTKREQMAAARAEELRRLEEKQREQLRRDIEWEKAAPRKAPPFGRVDGRHYVPQWKLDETGTSDTQPEQETSTTAERQLDRAPAPVESKTFSRRVVLNGLKLQINAILKRVFPNSVTFESLMTRTGCNDFELMKACVEEIIAENDAEFK